MTRRRRVDERGTAAVDLIAYLPFIVLAALVSGQLYASAWTATHTTSAARAAARADSLGGDPWQAARNALPRALQDDLEDVVRDGEGWRVRVRIPLLLSGLSTENLIVRRFAAFPDSQVLP